MKAKVFINQKAVNLVAAVGMLLAMLLPAAFPMLASADQLASRSIALSSSAADASGVDYKVTFTPSAVFQSVIVDFCGDSPIVGQSCGALTGFDASAATVAFNTGSIGTVSTTGTTTKHVVAVGTAQTADTSPVTFTISGVHNPTSAGSFYARIYTYASGTTGYSSVTSYGTTIDTGGIALSATTTIGVSAAVRETLTFCLSGSSITDCTSGLTTPNIALGHGTPAALDANTADTATVYTQIATNASHGATVYMKNSNACGGLSRDSGSTCDIAPSGASPAAITGGTALFGLQVTSTSGITRDTAYAGSSTNYGMNYVSGGASGVTSAYGDPIYDTTSGPINATSVPLVFAAAASNTTPAGLYRANMNLVATGTF